MDQNKQNPKRTKDGSNKDVFQFDQALGHVKKIHFNTAGELTDFTSGRLPADEIPVSTVEEEAGLTTQEEINLLEDQSRTTWEEPLLFDIG